MRPLSIRLKLIPWCCNSGKVADITKVIKGELSDVRIGLKFPSPYLTINLRGHRPAKLLVGWRIGDLIMNRIRLAKSTSLAILGIRPDYGCISP